MDTPRVTLNVRLVPKGFAAVTDPRRIPVRTVPFIWSESERLWRSVEPLFVTAARREGEGAYRAVSELADGPFYHTALRISGSPEDNAQTLQDRLDTELLHLIAPQRWFCLDCQRSLKKEKEAGPCARHKKEMPPVVLYRTSHPRVNRYGQYYVFGWARDYESTTPIFEHNDETWTPSLDSAVAEYEALRKADRLAAEQGAQEQAATDALSPEEKQAAFKRALHGETASSGTGSWAPAPEFTAEQQAAIRAFIGGGAVEWVANDHNEDNPDLPGVQYLYGAFGYESQFIGDLHRDELSNAWPAARPTATQALKAARTLVSAGHLLTCDESDEIELLYAAFGHEEEAGQILKDHLYADARPGRCFGLADDMTIADISTATAEERGFSGAVEHQRRIIELVRAGEQGGADGEGQIDVITPYGRAEAQPYRDHGIIEGYDVYHPNGVHVGYIRIDDGDDFSYETRGGDGDYLEGETPLSRVQRGVLLLVEHEGEAPFSGSLDYRCNAAHQACAHISDGPCHRDVAVANGCPADNCDGPTAESSGDE